MGFVIYFWVVAIAIIAVVYLCRWLYRLSTAQEVDDNSTTEEEEYGCTSHISCVNCDLVEQCQGWSPREKKHDEHDVISDFFMFNHLLDSDDKHDEKEHYMHDSFNCDNSWCECHEDDGYSWFDENGDEHDACW